MQADQGTERGRERYTQAYIHTEAQSSSADGDVSKPTPADELERLIRFRCKQTKVPRARARERERERHTHTQAYIHTGTEQQCGRRCASNHLQMSWSG